MRTATSRPSSCHSGDDSGTDDSHSRTAEGSAARTRSLRTAGQLRDLLLKFVEPAQGMSVPEALPPFANQRRDAPRFARGHPPVGSLKRCPTRQRCRIGQGS